MKNCHFFCLLLIFTSFFVTFGCGNSKRGTEAKRKVDSLRADSARRVRMTDSVNYVMFMQANRHRADSLLVVRSSRQHPDQFEMVLVKGGTFEMGNSFAPEADTHPAHRVYVSDFYIGRFEVTQAQWELVMGHNPSRYKGTYMPVETVNWGMVREFIQRLNARTGRRYRLPTEAEWEYAARGGSQSRGSIYSGSENAAQVAWYAGNAGGRPHPVGSLHANELLICDMTGNVSEWCGDWYAADYYTDSPAIDPQGPRSGRERVVRGGSYSNSLNQIALTLRSRFRPSYSHSTIGFRLAMDK